MKLRAENGRLHYQGSKGVLNRDDLAALAHYKGQILALLTGIQSLDVQIEPRERTAYVPLTYSQLAHWRRYRLGEQLHLRQIASATRLSGRLNLDALRNSLAEIVRRHEAMRIRIVMVDGEPMQKVADSAQYELKIDDLNSIPEELQETEVRRRIEICIAQPVDVTVGPLFAARLLRLRENSHVLVISMEHMISDGISLNIVLRDLLSAYEQAAASRPISWPDLPVQFADYAAWQADAQRARIKEHAAYWRERLASCDRAAFPEDSSPRGQPQRGWTAASIEIGTERQRALREWCRVNGATLPITVLAAYAALVLRWCKAQKIVVRYVTDGRITPALENTVGYFAYLLFLRVELRESDTLIDLVRQVTEEYCNAQECPHLGCIEAQTPLPPFARGCGFNWVPHGSDDDSRGARSSERSLICSPVWFDHPMLKMLEQDIDPFALFYDTPEGLIGTINYAQDRFSKVTMDRFVRNFLMFIDALVTRSSSRVASIPLA